MIFFQELWFARTTICCPLGSSFLSITRHFLMHSILFRILRRCRIFSGSSGNFGIHSGALTALGRFLTLPLPRGTLSEASAPASPWCPGRWWAKPPRPLSPVRHSVNLGEITLDSWLFILLGIQDFLLRQVFLILDEPRLSKNSSQHPQSFWFAFRPFSLPFLCCCLTSFVLQSQTQHPYSFGTEVWTAPFAFFGLLLFALAAEFFDESLALGFLSLLVFIK